MYNEELKSRFIEEYSTKVTTHKAARRVFKITARDEEQWGADLCTKTTEELQPVVDHVCGLTSPSKWTGLAILREYVRWCISNHVPGVCDGMLHITSAGLTKIKQQMVASPLHLQNFLDAVFDSESRLTMGNVYRGYYWLAYAGILEEDTPLIRTGDVDLSEMSIHYMGGHVPIYREALPVFKNLVNLTSFRYEHEHYRSGAAVVDRVPGDQLLRGIKANMSRNTFGDVLSKSNLKAFNEGTTTIRMSYQRAYLSGVFYRIYEQERAGLPASFEEIIDTRVRQMLVYKGKKWDRDYVEFYMKKIARDYEGDYMRWKMAFAG